MYEVGQGILAKIQFVDGCIPQYPRTYLIVDANENSIKVLNISSVEGKEQKLLFRFNKEIKNYNPPFLKRSFVKLDSLTEVAISGLSSAHILHNGEKLNTDEFKSIIKALNTSRK